VADSLPGMQPPLDPTNLYAADGPGRLSRVVRGFRPLVYVPNSESSSVDVIDPETFSKVARTWRLPGGGSPDMGGVSADGNVLWLSGRYHDEVYAIDTHSGRLLARIPVGRGPHGLCVYPQPGRYSLGHTGVFR
jgi:DNA-binding beta-propeller fold protein YncE